VLAAARANREDLAHLLPPRLRGFGRLPHVFDGKELERVAIVLESVLRRLLVVLEHVEPAVIAGVNCLDEAVEGKQRELRRSAGV